jgi:uncharacterized protein (DUF433 family)
MNRSDYHAFPAGTASWKTEESRLAARYNQGVNLPPELTSVFTAPEKSHIVCTPSTLSGKPRIDGSRIAVQDIYVWHELQGQTAEQIVKDFPHLTLAGVYAALAYFHDYREEILADMERQEKLVEFMKAKYPSKLPAAIERARGNAVSP